MERHLCGGVCARTKGNASESERESLYLCLLYRGMVEIKYVKDGIPTYVLTPKGISEMQTGKIWT